jgi:TRAP-type C4-dicarboxylate transport system substrate-binding protein
MALPQDITSILNTFLESLRKEWRDQWKTMEEHCREDMAEVYGKLNELEQWRASEAGKQDAQDKLDEEKRIKKKLSPAWISAIGKAVEVGLILAAIYIGHKIW